MNKSNGPAMAVPLGQIAEQAGVAAYQVRRWFDLGTLRCRQERFGKIRAIGADEVEAVLKRISELKRARMILAGEV
jgi:predicted site-specific integrase-resolvase